MGFMEMEVEDGKCPHLGGLRVSWETALALPACALCCSRPKDSHPFPHPLTHPPATHPSAKLLSLEDEGDLLGLPRASGTYTAWRKFLVKRFL